MIHNRPRRRRNREKDRAQKLRKQYNMTTDEWQAMYDRQGGRCAICGSRPRNTLQVDHCHTTNRVRGLLCEGCNSALGFFRDEASTIALAAVYVAYHQNPRDP